jgi:hypothetical protein
MLCLLTSTAQTPRGFYRTLPQTHSIQHSIYFGFPVKVFQPSPLHADPASAWRVASEPATNRRRRPPWSTVRREFHTKNRDSRPVQPRKHTFPRLIAPFVENIQAARHLLQLDLLIAAAGDRQCDRSLAAPIRCESARAPTNHTGILPPTQNQIIVQRKSPPPPNFKEACSATISTLNIVRQGIDGFAAK